MLCHHVFVTQDLFSSRNHWVCVGAPLTEQRSQKVLTDRLDSALFWSFHEIRLQNKIVYYQQPHPVKYKTKSLKEGKGLKRVF